MARSLIVEIMGNASGFAKELDRAAGKTRQMGKVAGVAGLAIAGGLAVGLEKSVKAAAESQVSTAKLDAAFAASKDPIGQYKGAIDSAESSGRSLGFTNTDVRDSLGTLEIATHSGAKAITDLSAAEDIARFKHISLADASKTLTMTMAGSTRAAHMLGIQTASVTTAEEKVKTAFKLHSGAAYTAALATAKLSDKQATAANVLELVRQKLGGQAQAFAGTAAGGMAQFHAQTQAIEENLGSALLPALGSVSQKLAEVTGWLAQHTTVAKIAVIALGTLSAILIGVSVATKLATAAEAIAQVATVGWTAAQWLLNAALTANPIGLVVVALVALAAGFAIAWEKSKTFRDIVTGAWTDVKNIGSSVANFFTSTIPQKFDAFKTDVTNAFKSVKDWVSNHWHDIGSLITSPFTGLLSAAAGAFGLRDKLSSAWSDIKSGARMGFSDIGSALASVLKAPVNMLIGLLDGIDFGVHYGGLKVLGHTVIPSVNFDWHPFHIPMLAEGGIAMGPTLALIGEKGPEAVVPLGKNGMGAGDSGGSPVNFLPGAIVIHGTADAAFARTLATELATQLRGGRVPQFQQAIKAL